MVIQKQDNFSRGQTEKFSLLKRIRKRAGPGKSTYNPAGRLKKVSILNPQPADPEAAQIKKRDRKKKILRFRKSERTVHWAIAVPFMVCFATALILVVFYNPDPLRPFRAVFSWIHRISGICLIVIPLLSIIKSRGDYKIYFYNIRQAWLWTFEDLKWLSMIGLASVSKRFTLPEQGKFNAAEKINFMTLMSTYPLYILTGAIIWLTDGAFLSWLLHFAMAMIATPLISGHIFMATVNPDTRAGLTGMTSGYVDRQWAKHHYSRWYREHFESSPVLEENPPLSEQRRGKASLSVEPVGESSDL